MSRGQWAATMLAAVLALRLLLLLSEPGMAWGLSLSLVNWIWVALILCISVALVVAPLLAWLRPYRRDWRVNLIVIAIGFSLSYALHHLFIEFADRDYGFKKSIYTDQIEYFCLNGFHLEKCTILVNACPSCVAEIERYKRDKMVELLKKAEPSQPNVQK